MFFILINLLCLSLLYVRLSSFYHHYRNVYHHLSSYYYYFFHHRFMFTIYVSCSCWYSYFMFLLMFLLFLGFFSNYRSPFMHVFLQRIRALNSIKAVFMVVILFPRMNNQHTHTASSHEHIKKKKKYFLYSTVVSLNTFPTL